MNYTVEELRKLPIKLLKNIDIRNGDEEKLVQTILNERKISESVEILPYPVTSAMTDAIKTVEQEKELQAKIDAYKQEQFDRISGDTEDVSVKSPVQCVHCLEIGGEHKLNCFTLLQK